ncbi:MAG: hypothetical protein ACE5JR_00780 [Gemmatimonadota bacterium]
MGGSALLKKLLWRLDGAADSAKVEFISEAGNRWEAELSLHSGTDPQSPRLMILFRNRSAPHTSQRYNLAPIGVSKVPREAAKQLSEAELRELLATSVEL